VIGEASVAPAGVESAVSVAQRLFTPLAGQVGLPSTPLPNGIQAPGSSSSSVPPHAERSTESCRRSPGFRTYPGREQLSASRRPTPDRFLPAH
jgi:hypothetical protein